ncbi:MAG: amidohydrolase [Cyclobacteriaceae bacterium]|nr:amidohydrolase [Cyclobacteriaceae bacterium]
MTREQIDILTRFRHDLHASPELSGKEYNTKKMILDFFRSRNPDQVREISDTGLIISFNGRKSRRNVLIRAEMDALPIRETNQFYYKSSKEDVAHKCGHDGHMAILSGVGDWCAGNRLEYTDVHLLFQPAEETGQGARSVLDHPGFGILPDYCFAIHNIPGFRKKTILLRENFFSASVISITIVLSGKTAHAAEPENGINPALAVAEIINVFNKLNRSDPRKKDFFISTPVFINMGEQAYGTSAGQVRLGYTFRCWENELLIESQAAVREILYQIAGMNNLELEFKWNEEFYANFNHPEAVRMVRKSAEELNYNIEDLELPFRWGEDFGFFTNRFKGAMIGIGSGTDTPALHHQDYDFPDDIIETGVNLYKEILTNIDQK